MAAQVLSAAKEQERMAPTCRLPARNFGAQSSGPHPSIRTDVHSQASPARAHRSCRTFWTDIQPCERSIMSRVFVNIGLSLDGYMAPEGMTMENWDKPEYTVGGVCLRTCASRD